MTAKLRIKAKGIEIEWEGEVEYLKNDLPDLIAAIVAALGISGGGEDDEDGEAAAPLNPDMNLRQPRLLRRFSRNPPMSFSRSRSRSSN